MSIEYMSPQSTTETTSAGEFWSKSVALILKNKELLFTELAHWADSI